MKAKTEHGRRAFPTKGLQKGRVCDRIVIYYKGKEELMNQSVKKIEAAVLGDLDDFIFADETPYVSQK